jgi:hypothetical protein
MIQKRPGFFIFILFIFAFISCVKQPFFAGEGAVIKISAPKYNIDFNESVTIQIVGYHSDGSWLWDGTQIDLTVENGSLSASSVELEDGHAEVVATGNVSRGEMKVYARSGNVVVESPLVFNVGTHPEVKYININLNPAVLPAGGGTVKIVVYIYDSFYQPIFNRAVLIGTANGTLQSKGNPLFSDEQGRVIDYLNTWKTTIVTVNSGDIEESVKVIVGG